MINLYLDNYKLTFIYNYKLNLFYIYRLFLKMKMGHFTLAQAMQMAEEMDDEKLTKVSHIDVVELPSCTS